MIKIKCDSWEELLELCRKVLQGTDAASKQQDVPSKQRIMSVVTPAVIEPVKTPLAPIPDVAEEVPFEELPKPEPAHAAASKQQVSYQDVQTKAIALMDAKKQDQLQALLQKYNVPALPSLPEDQYAAFLADMEAV